jgi:hypothetical protein
VVDDVEAAAGHDVGLLGAGAGFVGHFHKEAERVTSDVSRSVSYHGSKTAVRRTVRGWRGLWLGRLSSLL